MKILSIVNFLFLLIAAIHCIDAEDVNDLTSLKWNLRDEPVQLLMPDLTHKKLVLIEENVKMLYNIDGAVAVVAVVGKFHSGKSFLMNQLMRKSAGFGIGPSVKPTTMGIWMWGMPLEIATSAGSKISVIFFDTEGFAANNISEAYDAKIFAVSTLMSSYLIYNSVKIIDQSDIDYLEILARRTQLFALRSQLSKAKWTDEINHSLLSFPPLLWVVQDFVQTTDTITAKEWIHNLMASHSRENDHHEVTLMDIFKIVDCHTLFLPATKKFLLQDLSMASEDELTEDYRQERDALILKLYENVSPKQKNGKPLTGPELVRLLEILVTAANEGSLAEVPTRWDSFIQHLKDTATEDCVLFYEGEIALLNMKHNNEPISMKDLTEWHQGAMNKSVKLLEHLLFGLEDAIKDSKGKIVINIEKKFEKTKEFNDKRIKLKCTEVQGRIETDFEERVEVLNLPQSSIELGVLMEQFVDEYLKIYFEKLKSLISGATMKQNLVLLQGSLSKMRDTIFYKNNKAFEEFLNGIIEFSRNLFTDLTKDSSSKPLSLKSHKQFVNAAKMEVVANFESKSNSAIKETFYDAFRALLITKLEEMSLKLHQDNELKIKTFAFNIVKDLQHGYTEATSHANVPIPVESTILEESLTRLFGRIELKYKQLMEEFEESAEFASSFENLKGEISKIIKTRHKENIEAFTREVSVPLETSKKVILLAGDKYTTTFNLKKFMQNVCLLNLNDGTPKKWDPILKMKIINNFIDGDKELQELLQRMEGWWSSFIGFFQWILWIFNIA